MHFIKTSLTFASLTLTLIEIVLQFTLYGINSYTVVAISVAAGCLHIVSRLAFSNFKEAATYRSDALYKMLYVIRRNRIRSTYTLFAKDSTIQEYLKNNGAAVDNLAAF